MSSETHAADVKDELEFEVKQELPEDLPSNYQPLMQRQQQQAQISSPSTISRGVSLPQLQQPTSSTNTTACSFSATTSSSDVKPKIETIETNNFEAIAAALAAAASGLIDSNANADQLEALRKTYLSLHSSGQLNPSQLNINNTSTTLAAGNNNPQQQQRFNNNNANNNSALSRDGCNTSPTGIAAMVSALAQQQQQQQQQQTSSSDACEALALLQQQVVESLLQQQQQQNGDATPNFSELGASLLTAMGGANLSSPPRQSQQQRQQQQLQQAQQQQLQLQTHNGLMEMAMEMALNGNNNSSADINTALSAALTSGAVTPDALISIISGINGQSNGAQQLNDLGAAFAANMSGSTQFSGQFGSVSKINSNDSKFSIPSSPTTGNVGNNNNSNVSQYDLMNLIGNIACTSPELLGVLSAMLSGNSGNGGAPPLPAQNLLTSSMFASMTGNGDLSNLLSAAANNMVAAGGSSSNVTSNALTAVSSSAQNTDTNAALVQFITSNANNAGAFGYSNSPNKSLDSYCEICDKNLCNRYFLRTHKQKKHGIYTDDSAVGSGGVNSPTKSNNAPISTFFASSNHSQQLAAGFERTSADSMAAAMTSSGAQKRPIKHEYGGGESTDAEGGGASDCNTTQLIMKMPKLSSASSQYEQYNSASRGGVLGGPSASNMTFSSASAPPTNVTKAGEQDRKPSDSFDFMTAAEQLQKHSLSKMVGNFDEASFAAAAAAFLDAPSTTAAGAATTTNGATGSFGCDMCVKECDSHVALFQHKFSAHVASLIPTLHNGSAGSGNGGGSNGATDEVSPPQSSPSIASDGGGNNNNTGNNNNNNMFAMLSQQLPYLLTPQVVAQLTGNGELDPASTLNALAKLAGFDSKLDMDNLTSASNASGLMNSSASDKTSTPKRQYTSTSKNYCDVCHKVVCNKYFLRTHMLKMHQIVIDENKPIIAKIDTNEKERNGSIMFRCDICMKELRTRTDLKLHKAEEHNIRMHGTPPGSRDGSTMAPLTRTPKASIAGMPTSSATASAMFTQQRMSSSASLDSGSATPPPRPPSSNYKYQNPFQNQARQHSQVSSQSQQAPHRYYRSENGTPEIADSTEKGITNFLPAKDEPIGANEEDQNNASESNNNNKNSNNNNILKIETNSTEGKITSVEQLEHILSSMAAAAAGAVDLKKEPSDGGSSAGVSSPSTSSSATFEANVSSTHGGTMTTSASIAAPTIRDEEFAATAAGAQSEDVDLNALNASLGHLSKSDYKDFITRLFAATAAASKNNNNNNSNGNNNNNNNNNNGYSSEGFNAPLDSSDLLRQIARIQQENHQLQQRCFQ